MLNKKGITILEVLLTITIASLITAIGFSSFYQWRNSVSLINQVDELKSKIVEVRQMAISAAGETGWGIHFEDTQYIIFSGDSYNQNNPNNQSVLLKNAIINNPSTSLSNGNGAYSQDLIFTKYSGETVNIGTLSIRSDNNADIIKSFSINNLGNVN